MLHNKGKFDRSQKGLVIDNLPDKKGVCTGWYFIDFYGCWWEVKQRNGKCFYMIGEYPENYYNQLQKEETL